MRENRDRSKIQRPHHGDTGPRKKAKCRERKESRTIQRTSNAPTSTPFCLGPPGGQTRSGKSNQHEDFKECLPFLRNKLCFSANSHCRPSGTNMPPPKG